MFDFLKDSGNYESRCVAKSEYPWGFISTARVSDGKQPFETAIKHKKYNDGSMVIVAAYDTKEEAQKGHLYWIKIMTAGVLPEKLIDIANSHIASFLGPTEFQLQE